MFTICLVNSWLHGGAGLQIEVCCKRRARLTRGSVCCEGWRPHFCELHCNHPPHLHMRCAAWCLMQSHHDMRVDQIEQIVSE